MYYIKLDFLLCRSTTIMTQLASNIKLKLLFISLAIGVMFDMLLNTSCSGAKRTM